MSEVVARLDAWGMPAWIAAMVLGFVIFWPVGLAILGYLIWSGRMGCERWNSGSGWQQRRAGKWERKMERWGMQAKAYQPTGNHAFDEYRDETLKRLEEEAEAFESFLERLRMAKDRTEFEQFMAERRNRPSGTGQTPEQPGGTAYQPGA
jgi:hypothetical protein